MNLIRGFNPWLLLAFSLAICAIVPNLVTLATILAWVANTLHQVLLHQTTLALAPTVWVVLLALSLWQPTSIMQPPKNQNKTVPLTRSASSSRETLEVVAHSATLQRRELCQHVALLISSPSPTTRLCYCLRGNHHPTCRLPRLRDPEETYPSPSASRCHAL